MNQAKQNIVDATRLLSTMSDGDVYEVDEAETLRSIVVEVEQLDDLGALMIRTLDAVVVLEAEVERLRRETSHVTIAGQLYEPRSAGGYVRVEAEREQLVGVDLVDVPDLLYPYYLRPRDPVVRRLAGLVEYDTDKEEHRYTDDGDDVVAEIRRLHGLTFVDDAGGGRWHVEGDGLHAGDGLDVLLADGRWQPARFEVIFRDHPHARNGRLPRFHIATAGGSSFACYGDGEDWSSLLVRRERA